MRLFLDRKGEVLGEKPSAKNLPVGYVDATVTRYYMRPTGDAREVDKWRCEPLPAAAASPVGGGADEAGGAGAGAGAVQHRPPNVRPCYALTLEQMAHALAA